MTLFTVHIIGNALAYTMSLFILLCTLCSHTMYMKRDIERESVSLHNIFVGGIHRVSLEHRLQLQSVTLSLPL